MADTDDSAQSPQTPEPDGHPTEPGEATDGMNDADAEAAMDAASRAADALAGQAAGAPSDASAAAALAAAMAAVGAVQKDTNSAASAPAKPAAPSQGRAPGARPAAGEDAKPFSPPEFQPAPPAPLPAGMDLLSDVNLNVRIELGRTTMFVEDVLKLGEGAVVELDKLAGDPVDIYVNGRHVARGEVLVLNDNFCVRISEILDRAGRDAAKAAGA